jgi:hypothetical protein
MSENWGRKRYTRYRYSIICEREIKELGRKLELKKKFKINAKGTKKEGRSGERVV